MRMEMMNIYALALMLLLSLILPGSVFAQDTHDHDTSDHKDELIEVESLEGHDHDEAIEDSAELDSHEGHGHEEAVVNLTPAEIEEFGMKIAIARPGVLNTSIAVPGEVVPNGDRLAHIAPRFPGVVTEVRKNIGDMVMKGDILAVVESNEGLAPYKISSLLDGIVIDKHITIGEVKTGDEPAFVIADLETVWVNLSLYQINLPYVRVGQSVDLSFGEGIPNTEGIISYISPIIDKHTRTATARVVLPSKDGLMRPGLFAEGRIKTAGLDVSVLVEKSAIQIHENESVVFVLTDEGFEPQVVTTGRSNGTHVEILSGLEVGEKYVADGGFVLKAELGKGEFGHDHAH